MTLMPILLLLGKGLGVFVIVLGGMWLGARRFAAQQRRLGRWTEDGPKDPTEPLPSRTEWVRRTTGLNRFRNL